VSFLFVGVYLELRFFWFSDDRGGGGGGGRRVNGVWSVMIYGVGVWGMLISRVRVLCEGWEILAGGLVILVEGGGLI
jgi:hypothetical protein